MSKKNDVVKIFTAVFDIENSEFIEYPSRGVLTIDKQINSFIEETGLRVSQIKLHTERTDKLLDIICFVHFTENLLPLN